MPKQILLRLQQVIALGVSEMAADDLNSDSDSDSGDSGVSGDLSTDSSAFEDSTGSLVESSTSSSEDSVNPSVSSGASLAEDGLYFALDSSEISLYSGSSDPVIESSVYTTSSGQGQSSPSSGGYRQEYRRRREQRRGGGPPKNLQPGEAGPEDFSRIPPRPKGGEVPPLGPDEWK